MPKIVLSRTLRPLRWADWNTTILLDVTVVLLRYQRM